MEPLQDLTKEDFLAYSGEDITAGCEKKDCLAYSNYFVAKANDAIESDDAKAQQIYTLLAALTMSHFRDDSVQGPFGVINLDDSRVQFLTEIVDGVSDAELRARIADILCQCRPDHRMAERAVYAYLETAKRLEDPEHWTATAHRFDRAVKLAAKWGRKSDKFTDSVASIEEVLAKYDGEDPLFLSAYLMTSLQDVNAGDANTNATRAEKAALRAESASDWHRAKEYWEVKARWHSQGKDRAAMLDAKRQGAETRVKEVEEIVSRDNPSYMQASGLLNRAIDGLRRIEGTKERVAHLIPLLLEYQKKGMDEMVPISASEDITDLVETIRNHVKGQTLPDALARLAMIANPPKIAHLKEQAEGYRDKFLFARLFPNVYYNAMGKVIARQPQDKDEALLADMFHNASTSRGILVQGLIEPARYQILSEHYYKLDDLLPYVTDNPFVRPGREYIVAHGLFAGLQGNFLSAVHLLIPQAEDSLRYLLFRLKVIASGMDDEGIQDEYNLNRLLSAAEFTGPLSKVLGEDFVFDLRGLLVERFGDNLRNDMSHGLLSHDAFYTNPSCYFWWAMLRLYAWPTIARLPPEDTE